MDKPALAKRRLLIMSKLQTPCISEILVVEEQLPKRMLGDTRQVYYN